MSIIERVRISGKCPPSLICVHSDIDFEATAVKVVDANELYLSFEPTVPVYFKKLLELTTSNTGNISGDDHNRNAILITRRSVVLTLVASTPIENTTLDTVLRNGYLSTVKLWMDDILKGELGGIDLLLHLLTKISQLPVTKSIVKESGLGKTVGSIEKHRICADSPNKVAIVERVNTLMDAWRKSVKIRKDRTQNIISTSDKTSLSKRGLENSHLTSSPAKKVKLDDTKKSSFSNLLKKVDPTSILNTSDKSSSVGNGDASKKGTASKKQGRRLKWKDHFGGKLEASKIIDEETLRDENTDDASGSWSDRKRRDRLREKELIANAKKSKLMDDDDDLARKSPMKVQPTIVWHAPPSLPPSKDTPPSQNNSKEKISQTTRMASAVRVAYMSEAIVPMNPLALSDVEQALDMTSHSSVVAEAIPFFVPQAPPAPAPASQTISTSTQLYQSSQAQSDSGIASAETVQALGLPSFLTGQNLQALQTLAGNPKLLGSYVDSTGMYDQVRLMNLVQTLSQNSPTSGEQNQGANAGFQQSSIGQSVAGTYGQVSGNGGIYGTSSNGTYANNNWQGTGMKSGGYRGAQNSSEGNLHLSGYGPGTTQSEIIALFSPYVQVSEVVMKATFSFVNTNDPMGAKQAREALNGALLGGAPVRINMAMRKNRDAIQNAGGTNTGSYYGRNTGMQSSNAGFSGMSNSGFGQSQLPPPPAGVPSGQSGGDLSTVRDDRGNPATKNLFVAGYGHGTTENHLREIFSAHTQIVGIISKGTFSFINTTDKAAAIHAREVLSGTMVNGGVLRINFAKETGRLGTSFDLTYGGGNGQNRTNQVSHQGSHYGRSY